MGSAQDCNAVEETPGTVQVQTAALKWARLAFCALMVTVTHRDIQVAVQVGAAKLTANGSTPGGVAAKIVTRARLKLLAWRVEQGQGDPDSLQAEFEAAVAASRHDDKAHMEFAVFLRKVYEDLRAR